MTEAHKNNENISKKKKYKSLYRRIITDTLLISIFGCVVVVLVLNNIAGSSLKKLNRSNLEESVPAIMTVIEDEKASLKSTALYAQNNFELLSKSNSLTIDEVNNFVKEFNLYGACYSEKSGTVIETFGKTTKVLSDAELQSIRSASSNPKVFVSVKDGEILFVTSIDFMGNVLTLEMEFSSLSTLEKYAMLMSCVFTVFIDDLRVETTIKDDKGNYLVGTTLNNEEIYKEIYTNKKTYHGDNVINGLDYISVYLPIPNNDNKNASLFMGISTDHVKTIKKDISAALVPSVIFIIFEIIFVIMLLFAKLVMKPLGKTGKAFEILNGQSGVSDLTIRIDSKNNDEIGKITNEINIFISSQQDLLGDVKTANDSLKEIGESLASSSQQSASAISQIMANIESVNHSVEKQTMALQNVQDRLIQNRENVTSLEELILKQSEGIS